MWCSKKDFGCIKLAKKDFIILMVKNTILLVIYYFIAMVLYDIIAEATLPRASSVFYTPIDLMISFNPYFVIFYVFIFYPFVLYTVGYFTYIKPEKANRFYFAAILIYAISYLTYLIYPVKMNRPDLSGAKDFLSRVMYNYYQSDLPVNCFPSLHAANSTLAAYFLSKENRKLSILFWFIAIGVMVATLFVRQHVIADEISGFLVAIFASILSEKIIAIKEEVKEYFTARVVFTLILATLFSIITILSYLP